MSNNRTDGDRSTEIFRKLFIGGLSIETDEDVLKTHFEQWGELVDVVVMRIGGRSGKSRGFGFITYKEPEMLDECQSNRPHIIAGRTVETKRAMPRDEANSAEAHMTASKLFVGALKKEVTADDLRDYFGGYGTITECEVITWRETGQSRGFGFVTYDDYDPVDKVLLHKPHYIDNKRCEVKKAISKEEARTLKAKESLGVISGSRYPQQQHQQQPYQQHNQSNGSMMGFMGDIRNSLNSRFDSFGGYQDNNSGSGSSDRFGRYADQGYSGGPMRDNMSYNRSQPYDSNRMRRDYY